MKPTNCTGTLYKISGKYYCIGEKKTKIKRGEKIKLRNKNTSTRKNKNKKKIKSKKE